jgi:hypothetical protein
LTLGRSDNFFSKIRNRGKNKLRFSAAVERRVVVLQKRKPRLGNLSIPNFCDHKPLIFPNPDEEKLAKARIA